MNNRIIKFRAWDKLHNKMSPGLEVLTPYGATRLHNQIGVKEERPEHYAGADDLVFLQFTGLLDKNGKEIYEGDIIQVFTKELKEKAYTVVIQDMVKDKFFGVGNGEGEVIGNIYENPELLK